MFGSVTDDSLPWPPPSSPPLRAGLVQTSRRNQELEQSQTASGGLVPCRSRTVAAARLLARLQRRRSGSGAEPAKVGRVSVGLLRVGGDVRRRPLSHQVHRPASIRPSPPRRPAPVHQRHQASRSSNSFVDRFFSPSAPASTTSSSNSSSSPALAIASLPDDPQRQFGHQTSPGHSPSSPTSEQHDPRVLERLRRPSDCRPGRGGPSIPPSRTAACGTDADHAEVEQERRAACCRPVITPTSGRVQVTPNSTA